MGVIDKKCYNLNNNIKIKGLKNNFLSHDQKSPNSTKSN